MVLLHIISQITAYQFIVVSIDHSIRKDSIQDIHLVAKQTEHYNLQFFSEKVAVPNFAKQVKKGLEEAARDIRYRILQKYKKKFKATAIITAHHQDDQLETILFHLIRGSDVHGLIGMQTLNQQGIFRPLLSVTKQDILRFAQEKKLKWREDSSNQDTNLSRNFIRKHVVAQFPRPLLLQVSCQAEETIAAFDQYIIEWLNLHFKKNQFLKSSFLQLPLYLQLYLLQYCLSYIQNL
jgi:tRNA(Ile)-lysidine synthase